MITPKHFPMKSKKDKTAATWAMIEPNDIETINARKRAAAAGIHVARWMNAAAIDAALFQTHCHEVLISARETWEKNKTLENFEAAKVAETAWEKSIHDFKDVRFESMKAAGLI